jgi:hypothetical protein
VLLKKSLLWFVYNHAQVVALKVMVGNVDRRLLFNRGNFLTDTPPIGAEPSERLRYPFGSHVLVVRRGREVLKIFLGNSPKGRERQPKEKADTGKVRSA